MSLPGSNPGFSAKLIRLVAQLGQARSAPVYHARQVYCTSVDGEKSVNHISATIFFGARPMVRLWTLNSEIEVRILSTEPFLMPATPLPNGQARDCKSRYPGSNPGGVSIFPSSWSNGVRVKCQSKIYSGT